MKPMYQSTPSAQESADTTDAQIPDEYRLVCSQCGADGGTYSFSVPQDEPAFCPWCGHVVDGDTTTTIRGDQEATGLSEGSNL